MVPKNEQFNYNSAGMIQNGVLDSRRTQGENPEMTEFEGTTIKI